MRRITLLFAIFILAAAPSAIADSISTFNITQAVVFVSPGSDNVYFTLRAPGTLISGFGGINCQQDWCNFQTFAPGSPSPVSFGFDGQIFQEGFSNATVGGIHLDPDSLGLDPFTLNTVGAGFNFPLSGTNFTGCQAAAMPASVSGSGNQNDVVVSFNLSMPSGGSFCSKWTFVLATDEFPAGYQFTSGKFDTSTTVPEPSPLVLLGSGLVGLALLLKKRFRKIVQR